MKNSKKTVLFSFQIFVLKLLTFRFFVSLLFWKMFQKQIFYDYANKKTNKFFILTFHMCIFNLNSNVPNVLPAESSIRLTNRNKILPKYKTHTQITCKNKFEQKQTKPKTQTKKKNLNRTGRLHVVLLNRCTL